MYARFNAGDRVSWKVDHHVSYSGTVLFRKIAAAEDAVEGWIYEGTIFYAIEWDRQPHDRAATPHVTHAPDWSMRLVSKIP